MSKKIEVAEEVLERLCQVLDCKNDTDLSAKLNVGRTTVSSWRSRGSIPYSECVEVAKRDGVSLDYLLIGRGAVAQNEAISEEKLPYKVDPLLNMKAVTQLIIDIAKTRDKEPDLMKLGLLRDFVYANKLTPMQINDLFELLEMATNMYSE